MEQKTIGLQHLPELRKAYKKAVKENKEQFKFEGNVLVVGYAKYLIEYLEIYEK